MGNCLFIILAPTVIIHGGEIIGARYFFKGYEARFGKLDDRDVKSARDTNGYGTHYASIAAGSEVEGASFKGFAKGTARGMAPQARLAVYKVAWAKGIDDCDIASAMEMAISDGVDILSMSIAGTERPFYEDIQAIGAFKAMAKGVLVLSSTDNEGPNPSSIENTTPWMITVGASIMNRQFPFRVTLGNYEIYQAFSLSKAVKVAKWLPLVYIVHNKSITCCESCTLDIMVNGKIVLCDAVNKNLYNNSIETVWVLKGVGVAAIIFTTEKSWGAQEKNRNYRLPYISVSFAVVEKLKAYIDITSNPTATINLTGSTKVGEAVTAPLVASISTRGPSQKFPDILKPDVVAPGVDILAANNRDEGFHFIISIECPFQHLLNIL